jgi:imidazole glycerol-phosphate synthase subunit HisF
MLKTRLIPVLLIKNGQLVRSKTFSFHQIIGNPIHEAARYNEWNVDELIYIDISREGAHDPNRDDLNIEGYENILDVLRLVAKQCFVPLTFGGGIRSFKDLEDRIQLGADKVTINTLALESPEFITEASRKFGSQAIVVSIDAKRNEFGSWDVVRNFGKDSTGLSPVDHARTVEKAGAGEIFIQSVDADGTGKGYEIDLIRQVSAAVEIPVIACSGVGKYDDFVAGVTEGGASAVSAANIFHFKELSDRHAKRTLVKNGINVRA